MFSRSKLLFVSCFLCAFGSAAGSAAGAGVQTTNAQLATEVLGGPVGAAIDGFGISKSGRYLVFSSWADDVVPGVDSGNQVQIYWLDRKTGSTKIVSVNANGQVANDLCSSPCVSDDGRKVVFLSRASNLGFPSNGKDQVYYADLVSGSLKLISRASNGQPGSERAWYPEISGDGMVATFINESPNMLPFLTPLKHVFVYEAQSDHLEIASVNNDGHFANEDSILPRLSKDGRFVVFESIALNLPNDSSFLGLRKIVLRDRVKDKTSLISQSQVGEAANASSFSASISDDGRYVAFLSSATNLTSGLDAPNTQDVFVADRKTGKLTRIAGQFDSAMEEFATRTSISNDGRRVAVRSSFKPPTLMGATINRGHVFDRKLQVHEVIEVVNPSAAMLNDSLQDFTLVGNGKRAFFISSSTHLELQGAQTHQVFVLSLADL